MRQLALASFALVSFALATIACSGSASEPSSSGPIIANDPTAPGSSSSSGGTNGGASANGGTSTSGGPSGAAKTAGDGGASADGGGVDKPAADPQCMTTCAQTMVQKCGGDPTICDEVCSLSATEIACLEAAPTCDKSVWAGCIQDQSNGGGK